MVDPQAPVAPGIQHPSALVPSCIQTSAPVQRSSCPSVCIGIPDSTSVFKVWSDKWDISLFEDITFNMVIVLLIEQAQNHF